MTTESRYSVWCDVGHRSWLSLEALDDSLSDGHCPKCGATIVRTKPELISVMCLDCRSEHDGRWSDVLGFFHEVCPTCASINDSDVGGRFHVVGCAAAEVSDYEEMQVREEAKLTARPAREDYWEYVVHFCTPKQFESIIQAGTVFAARTGYFKLPAVCLTDAPPAFTREIEDRHGSCGFVFKKSVLLKEGGGPAVYLAPSLLAAQQRNGGFSKALAPFVNIVRPPRLATTYLKPYDWLHEREWRVPWDIHFDEFPPEAVILPSGGNSRFSGFHSPKNVIAFARRYRELRRVKMNKKVAR